MPTRQKKQKKRIQLGVIISVAAKRKIEEMARNEGRSQGQICEELIKKGLDYDSRLAAIHDKLEEIRKSSAEREWHRAGYVPVHTEHGIIYVPRGHPGV